MSTRKGNTAILKIGLVLITISILLCGVFFLASRTTGPQNPQGSSISISELFDRHAVEANAENPFPDVDWKYWKEINPDVVGWITIPGTSINNPIVQAHSDDPDYYLFHDVYRNYNLFGSIYIDADNEEEGFNSLNTVILGHSIQGMPNISFGILPQYTDANFARDHNRIYLQTPENTWAVEPRFANIVPGWVPSKKTEFRDAIDFIDWYSANKSDADITMDEDPSVPDHAVTFVTCSYFHWAENERIVLTTSEATSSD